MASGLMTEVTMRSEEARLAMKARPTSLPVVAPRLRNCFTVTDVMTVFDSFPLPTC